MYRRLDRADHAGDRFIAPGSLAKFFPDPGDWKSRPIRAAFAWSGDHSIPECPLSDATPLHRRAWISHQATVVHRRVYEAVGNYDLRLKVRMDFDFWLRALARFPLHFIPEVLVDYETGGFSSRDPRRFFVEEVLAQGRRMDKPLWAIASSCKRYAREIWRSHRSGAV